MENSVFDRLISDLTAEERRRMAEKMKDTPSLSSQPLGAQESEERVDYENYTHTLSFLEKIIIFLKSLFLSSDREKVLGDYLINKLGKSVEKKYPGLIDASERFFGDAFYKEILSLKESVLPLKEAVSFALEINRMNFFAFLGSWFLPDVQQRFLTETDPDIIAEENPGFSNFEIRREIEFRIEDILRSISEEDRRMMYRYSRSLHIFGSLIKFDFNSILSEFSRKDKDEMICRFSKIRKPVKELGNILFSFKFPPEQEIFQSLYYYYSSHGKTDSAGYSSLEKFIETAEKSMESIRKFNRAVPVENILKIVYRNINYNSADISGGEDWFALYKKFWYKRYEVSMLKFTLKKKKEELMSRSLEVLNTESIQYLRYYRSKIWGDETFLRYENSAAVAYTFLSSVFTRDMLPSLKLILEDGKFYKEQNKNDFVDAYSAIVQTLEKLKILDLALAPGGEYTIEINEVKKESESDYIKLEKIKDIFAEIDGKVESVLREFIESLTMMSRILNGITHGEVGGPYDTLSNLGYIGKGKNSDLIATLVKITFTMNSFLDYFAELFDVERNSVAE